MFTGFYAAPYSAWAANPHLELPLSKLEELQLPVPATEKHWEFVAVALLHVRGYATAACSLSEADRETLNNLLRRCVHNHHAANWRLMRTLIQASLSGQAGLAGYPCLTYETAINGGLIVRPDGQLEDIPGDSSTQYHAYLLHLVMRFGDSQCPKLRAVVSDALRWLLRVAAEDGDPNARGRGRFQLFGYVSMAVCYRLAPAWGIQLPAEWGALVAKRLSYQLCTGALPLFWETPLRQELLLGYNTIDDYPAFARFWLEAPKGEVARPVASGAVFKHVLPGGSLLLADTESGPLLGVASRATNADESGLRFAMVRCATASRELLKEVGRRLRVVPPEAEPSPCLVGHTVVLADWTCSVYVGSRLQLEVRPTAQAEHQALSTLWVSPQLELDQDNSVFEGSVEVERFTWWKQDRLWEGYNVKTVRNARVLLSFKERK